MVASIRWLRSLRRYVAAAMIVAYAVVMSGMPLPTASQPAKSGELFPCATSGCGCDSAERCWTNCCCHTLAERLAWAVQHGVRPPEFALAEARAAGLDPSHWNGGPKTVNVTLVARPCCTKQSRATAPSCCSRRLVGGRTCCSKEQSPRQVVGWRALACQGQSLHWLAAVPTLISTPLQLAHELPAIAWLGPHSSDAAVGVSKAPTPPPPERA